MSKLGRPERLGPPDVEILQSLVAERPLAALGELEASEPSSLIRASSGTRFAGVW